MIAMLQLLYTSLNSFACISHGCGCWVLVCWRWRFDWRVACLTPVLTTVSIILSSNKIQNGDILVPGNPAVPGKWLQKWRQSRHVRIAASSHYQPVVNELQNYHCISMMQSLISRLAADSQIDWMSPIFIVPLTVQSALLR